MFKILLIEDDADQRTMYVTKFEQKNWLILAAKNGREGIVLAVSELPDLILLDVIMPELDGVEVLRRLKNNSRTHSIPVIMLSNLSEKQIVDQCLSLGAENYIIKADLSPADLVATVGKFLKCRS